LALLDLPPAGWAAHDGRRGGADVTAWRARLAVLRSEHGDAIGAKGAESPDSSAIGTSSAFGMRVDTPRQATEAGADRSWRDRGACLLRAANEAIAALLAPDPELDAERAVLAAHYAERDALPPQLQAYCFPCCKPVMLDDRMWSDARGWCFSGRDSAESSDDL
jgi:hypothetical protein